MIDALVKGRIYKAAVVRTAKSGDTIATCSTRTGTGMGDGGLFVNCIAFAPETVTTLLLPEPNGRGGDARSDSEDLYEKGRPPEADPAAQVRRVLTANHVRRKRSTEPGVQ